MIDPHSMENIYILTSSGEDVLQGGRQFFKVRGDTSDLSHDSGSEVLLEFNQMFISVNCCTGELFLRAAFKVILRLISSLVA